MVGNNSELNPAFGTKALMTLWVSEGSSRPENIINGALGCRRLISIANRRPSASGSS